MAYALGTIEISQFLFLFYFSHFHYVLFLQSIRSSEATNRFYVYICSNLTYFMSCWFNGYKMWYSIISTKWIWFQLVTRVLSHSLIILACLSTARGPVAMEKKPEWSLIQAVGVGILSLPRWYKILCLIFNTTPNEEKKRGCRLWTVRWSL